jgi:hypothetical protein
VRRPNFRSNSLPVVTFVAEQFVAFALARTVANGQQPASPKLICVCVHRSVRLIFGLASGLSTLAVCVHDM